MIYRCITISLVVSILSAGVHALAHQSSEEQCAFRVLKLSHTSTPQEIKQAFLKEVRATHPDKNNDPEATSKTQQLTCSYSLLNDPIKRELYRCPRQWGHSIGDSLMSFAPPTILYTVLNHLMTCFGALPLGIVDELQVQMQNAQNKSES